MHNTKHRYLTNPPSNLTECDWLLSVGYTARMEFLGECFGRRPLKTSRKR